MEGANDYMTIAVYRTARSHYCWHEASKADEHTSGDRGYLTLEECLAFAGEACGVARWKMIDDEAYSEVGHDRRNYASAS